MADTKLTGLTATTTPDATDLLYIVTDVGGTPTSKKIAYSDLGASSTELLALIAAQVNVSSIGDTYTDTAGDTYAETASQTRLTIGARPRAIVMVVSGHVSAGTGTFELRNFTDSASLGTATTTSTSEALLSGAVTSVLDTNTSDDITIRVKNSGAGGTTTIDGGGIAAGDIVTNITAIGSNNSLTPASGSNVTSGAWIASASIGLLKTPSTGTATFQVGIGTHNQSFSATFTPALTNIGAAFGTTEANTVITRTPSQKIIIANLRTSAIGATNRWGIAGSLNVKADNI